MHGSLCPEALTTHVALSHFWACPHCRASQGSRAQPAWLHRAPSACGSYSCVLSTWPARAVMHANRHCCWAATAQASLLLCAVAVHYPLAWLPQPPQFEPSFVTSTQTPPQIYFPAVSMKARGSLALKIRSTEGMQCVRGGRSKAVLPVATRMQPDPNLKYCSPRAHRATAKCCCLRAVITAAEIPTPVLGAPLPRFQQAHASWRLTLAAGCRLAGGRSLLGWAGRRGRRCGVRGRGWGGWGWGRGR